MKTKSYKIHLGDEQYKNYIEVSETVGLAKIKLTISGGGVALLNHKEWDELCGMKYELTCNMPENELSQIPDLASEADTSDSAEEKLVSTPMADDTIKRLMKGEL